MSLVFAAKWCSAEAWIARSGTKWAETDSRGKITRVVRLAGLAESSQTKIRVEAKRVAQAWIAAHSDVGIDMMLTKTDTSEALGRPEFTTWSGDLAFRESNTVTFSPDLVALGLAKVKLADLPFMLGCDVAILLAAERKAKAERLGMWKIVKGLLG